MISALVRILALFLTAAMIPCAAACEEPESLFEYRLLEDGSAVITGYEGSEADLAFPETLDGHPVSALGDSFDIRTASIRNIRSITVPDTMTVIEPGALQFAGYLEEIRIPEDHPVLSFEDGALYDKQAGSLLLFLQANPAESFSVPEGIRSIGEKAFFRAGLVSVSFPGSVERIAREAFYQCTRLSEVSLAEGLKTIETDAFTNCDKLREIVIPASVTEIEEAPFTDAHLKEIRVAPGNPVFTVSGGALINIRDGVLIAYPHFSEAESCEIPEGVKRIGALAFYRSHNLKKISFPEGLLEIGHGAFLMCNHLTAIELPDSIIRLEEGAFGGNSDAETLRLPAGLAEITGNFDDLAITELEIPEGVTVIERSFTSLPNLREVTVPDSVKKIGNNSFAFCKNLSSIMIPAGVVEIGTTFTGCSEALVIRTEAGSYAEEYCGEHLLNCELFHSENGSHANPAQ